MANVILCFLIIAIIVPIITVFENYANGFGGSTGTYNTTAADIYVKETAFDQFFLKAQEYADNNQYFSAVKEYNKALEIEPNNVELLNFKGHALNQISSHIEALEVLEQATKLDPTYTNAFENMAHSLEELGRYDEAIQIIDKAIEMNNDPTKGDGSGHLADSYAVKGNILIKQERYFEGLEMYDKALELGYYQPEIIKENKKVVWGYINGE